MSTENKKLIQAIKMVEQEKNISADSLFEAIENALLKACKSEFNKKNDEAGSDKPKNADKYNNMAVDMDRETGEYHVYLIKDVVEEVFDDVIEIALPDARLIETNAEIGDKVKVEVDSKQFSRTAISNAKGIIIQKIREEALKETGCEPPLSVLAQKVDSTPEEVSMALCAVSPAVSLTSSDDEEGQIDIAVESPDEKISDSLALHQVMNLLEPKDRLLLELRYYHNMTQVKTAEKLGMTQVQVSRREKKLLLYLRQELLR